MRVSSSENGLKVVESVWTILPLSYYFQNEVEYLKRQTLSIRVFNNPYLMWPELRFKDVFGVCHYWAGSD